MAGFDDLDALESDTPEEPREFLTDAENSELVAAVHEIVSKHQADGFRIQVAGSPVVGVKICCAGFSFIRRRSR